MIKQHFFIILTLFSLLFDNINCWCLKTQVADGYSVNDIDFSNDGSKFVTASNNSRVIVWNTTTLEQIKVINFTYEIFSVKFSKDDS